LELGILLASQSAEGLERQTTGTSEPMSESMSEQFSFNPQALTNQVSELFWRKQYGSRISERFYR
jgi:hypothetical protein